MLDDQASGSSADRNSPRRTSDALSNRLLTRKEAARYLGVAAQTLAVWACMGRYSLPHVKIGHRVFYKKVDLDAFIERHRVS